MKLVAIDLSVYRLLNSIESRNPKKVIFIARSGEQKDPGTAITTMTEIHNTMNDVDICAYGNLKKKDLPDFVDYYLTPPDEDIVGLLNSCSIFVITSVLEGYPAPPLEAMACGCAVVSTDSVGVREYLNHGVNGIVCPIKSPDLIAKSVLKLVADNQERIEIANRGYKTAINHSYETMCQNFLDAINSY